MNSTTASCIGSEKIVIDEWKRNTRVLRITFHCVKDGIALLCASLAIESINYGIDLVILADFEDANNFATFLKTQSEATSKYLVA